MPRQHLGRAFPPLILNPAVRIESGGQEGKFRSRRVWISEPVPKNEAKDRRPALGGSELLRNLPDSLARRTAGACACILVIVNVVWLPCVVCRAMPFSNSGRLVIASVCRWGIASRVNSVHQL